MDSESYGQFRLIGDKADGRGRHPAKLHMFAKMARRQTSLYAALYGSGRLIERVSAVERMSDLHGECQESPSSNFRSETWGIMVYPYDAGITVCAHYILGQYREEAPFEKTNRNALAPGAKKGTRGSSRLFATSIAMQDFWEVRYWRRPDKKDIGET